MPTRNISLTNNLDEFVASTLASGQYSNASELVREALRLLAASQETEALRREAFRAEVNAGIADIEAGRFDSFQSTEELQDALTALRSEVYEMA